MSRDTRPTDADIAKAVKRDARKRYERGAVEWFWAIHKKSPGSVRKAVAAFRAALPQLPKVPTP